MSTLVPPSAVRDSGRGTPGAPRSPVDEVAPPGPGAPALARDGASLGGLRIGALGISVATGVALARALGPERLGQYETAMAWAALLGVLAGAGTEKLVVREVAAARARGELGLARGLVRSALCAVILAAAATAMLVTLGAAILGERVPLGVPLVAAAVVPLGAVLRMRQATLQGLGAVVRGQVPELLVAPGMFLAALASVVLLDAEISASAALLLQAGALATAVLIAFGPFRSAAMRELGAARPTYAIAAWRRAALPLSAIAGLQILNARADVLMLGALGADGAVGRYATCSRVAGVIAMALLAANTALAPTVARLHTTGRRVELQRTLTATARTTFAIALPIGVGLALGGGVVLAVFGDGFTSARPALTVLACGQLVNVAMGSVGLVLLMTGHERTVVLALAVSASCNLALDFVLIPELGELGAAIAAAASLTLWNALLARGVWRHLGLRSDIFGRRT